MYRDTRAFLAALLALVFALPVNVYLIGDALGAGVQFPFFRYQQTYLGTSLITLFRDFDYVTTGALAGRTALSILLWVGGTLLLVSAVAYLVLRRHEGYETVRKLIALLVAGAGVAYLASAVAQYGPLLHGPSGFCIPVGVPLIFGIAWWAYRAKEEEDEPDESWEGSPDVDDTAQVDVSGDSR